MIAFLPELPAAPVPLTAPLPRASQVAAGTATLDFAGLLDAALPAAVAIGPETAQSETALAVTGLPVTGLPSLPGETPLPPLAVGLRALADAPLEPPPATAPEAATTPATDTAPGGTVLPQTGGTLPLSEPPAMLLTIPAAPAPVTPAQTPVSVAAAPAEDDAEEGPEPLTVPESVPAAVPLGAPALVLAPVVLAAPPPAAPVSRTPLPAAAPLTVRVTAAPRGPAPQSSLPLAPVSEEASASAPSVPAPALLPELVEAAPSVAAPTQPATPALAQTAPAQPAPTERAEVRGPSASQESTIAQVGEIREALRSVRPEMTLRHAEFGLISLRIEGAASQDPRAVLASRDPGFIPAIQAALAERAVAAAADTAGTGNHTGSGSGSGSDQRSYGFSLGPGQSSSQPYLEQSGKRDEGASQHQRQQQRRADEAASAGAGDAAPGDARDHGLFA